jgi:hypothetical protein
MVLPGSAGVVMNFEFLKIFCSLLRKEARKKQTTMHRTAGS